MIWLLAGLAGRQTRHHRPCHTKPQSSDKWRFLWFRPSQMHLLIWRDYLHPVNKSTRIRQSARNLPEMLTTRCRRCSEDRCCLAAPCPGWQAVSPSEIFLPHRPPNLPRPCAGRGVYRRPCQPWPAQGMSGTRQGPLISVVGFRPVQKLPLPTAHRPPIARFAGSQPRIPVVLECRSARLSHNVLQRACGEPTPRAGGRIRNAQRPSLLILTKIMASPVSGSCRPRYRQNQRHPSGPARTDDVRAVQPALRAGCKQCEAVEAWR